MGGRKREPTTVRDVMSSDVVSVAPTATVAEAATVMGRRHVGSALVLEEDRCVGIFTERDIVRALAADFDAPGQPISHWMTPDPESVGPELGVREALERMLAAGYRHLPVVEGEKTVGIVSMRDLAGGV
jgi:CBS domain-containing protein